MVPRPPWPVCVHPCLSRHHPGPQRPWPWSRDSPLPNFQARSAQWQDPGPLPGPAQGPYTSKGVGLHCRALGEGGLTPRPGSTWICTGNRALPPSALQDSTTWPGAPHLLPLSLTNSIFLFLGVTLPDHSMSRTGWFYIKSSTQAYAPGDDQAHEPQGQRLPRHVSALLRDAPSPFQRARCHPRPPGGAIRREGPTRSTATTRNTRVRMHAHSEKKVREQDQARSCFLHDTHRGTTEGAPPWLGGLSVRLRLRS